MYPAYYSVRDLSYSASTSLLSPSISYVSFFVVLSGSLCPKAHARFHPRTIYIYTQAILNFLLSSLTPYNGFIDSPFSPFSSPTKPPLKTRVRATFSSPKAPIDRLHNFPFWTGCRLGETCGPCPLPPAFPHRLNGVAICRHPSSDVEKKEHRKKGPNTIMVGVPGKFKGCETCRLRRVKVRVVGKGESVFVSHLFLFFYTPHFLF